MVQGASAGLCLLLIKYVAYIHICKHKQYFSGKDKGGIPLGGTNRRKRDNIKTEWTVFVVCGHISSS
jgi:hypothetical protein